MTGDRPTETPVLALTDRALAKVLKLRAEEGAAQSLALWVEVSGTIAGAYTYDMYFQAATDAGPDAWTGVQEGLTIVVPGASAPNARVGSVLDLGENLMGSGMKSATRGRPQASPAMAGPPPGPERGRGPAGHPGARRPGQPVLSPLMEAAPSYRRRGGRGCLPRA